MSCTWSGAVYVSFVIDAFSRRIVGWKADTTMKTSLVLDTLEMALWTRQQAGLSLAEGMIHHPSPLAFSFSSHGEPARGLLL